MENTVFAMGVKRRNYNNNIPLPKVDLGLSTPFLTTKDAKIKHKEKHKDFSRWFFLPQSKGGLHREAQRFLFVFLKFTKS